MQPKSAELKFVTKNDGYVHIHPSSVNYQVRMALCASRDMWGSPGLGNSPSGPGPPCSPHLLCLGVLLTERKLNKHKWTSK